MEPVENWDSRLVELAREVVGEPFEWGVTDCASLVRRALKVMYGRDVWKGHVGEWKTLRGAVGVNGRTDRQEALRSSGAVEVAKSYAWSGDVALGASEDDHGMLQVAVLLPTRKAMTSTPRDGVVIVDKLSLAEGTTFWRYASHSDEETD